jgi:protein O-GlcNAc transferase
MIVDEAIKAAIQNLRAGKTAEAESICAQVLAQMPSQPDALHLLGLAALRTGKVDAAVEKLGEAVKVYPQSADFQNNYGLALALKGRLDEGVTAFEAAVKIRPAYPEAMYNLADALCGTSRWREARAVYERAMELRPHDAASHRNLGIVLVQMQQWDYAIRHCRASLAMEPNHAGTQNTLGMALAGIEEPDEAAAAFEEAVRLKPDFVDAMNNLANVYSDTGQIRRARECRERAVALDPTRADSDSNRIYGLYFDPDYRNAELLQESRLWDQRHGEPLRHLIRPHENDRGADRPLRVGYVFPDMHSHPAFIPPLLLNHDRERIKIYCYSDLAVNDPVTVRLHDHADAWRQTSRLSDAQLAEQIREDRIDILVDLVLHMSGSRLVAFAYKPAPVQVCWLAHPGTGLSTMDYRLTDEYLDPRGEHDEWYVEKSIRLSPTFACYDPTGVAGQVAGPADPGPLPAQVNGYITFGCLNNFCKVNEGVLKLWSRVMEAVPRSRLRLLAPVGEARLRVLRTMKESGVEEGRVVFVARQPRPAYLAEYGRIDICLDTLPYAGHATSLDAMWMGVPVVTRVGATAAGRVGLSLMRNMKLTELAAGSDDEFVRVAAELAGDVPRLAELRRTLGRRLLESPLMDGKKFARNVEAAFSEMWKTWTAGS